MADQEQYEETITCPVCFSRYDEEERKPKYLVSCCHTICRLCLQVLLQQRIYFMESKRQIICPMCRCSTDCFNGVDSLPTNSDKLYLLKLEKPLYKSHEEAMKWCFTCRKRISPDCSLEKHSIINMDSQLLNSEIRLNISSISTQIQSCSKQILKRRTEIDAKLEHMCRWLDAFKERVARFKTANASRISELTDVVHGTDLTITIQKLMQLSISNEPDVGLLKDSLQEEAVVKQILQEFELVENTAEVASMERFSELLDMPSLPCIRKELDFASLRNDKKLSYWPVVLIESLLGGHKYPVQQDYESMFSFTSPSPSRSPNVKRRASRRGSHLIVNQSSDNILYLAEPSGSPAATNSEAGAISSTQRPFMQREIICASRRRFPKRGSQSSIS